MIKCQYRITVVFCLLMLHSTSAEDGFKVRKEDKANEDPDADGDENVYAEVK